MADEKKPRWESEDWRARQPNPKACETCVFSHGEAPWSDEPIKACCEMYEYPDSKPKEVYFDGGECEYYDKQE